MSTKAKPLLSYEELHKHFIYEPETGILRWKITSNPRAKAGYICGCSVNPSGHMIVILKQHRMLVHRVIWKMMTGEEPLEIDHIDCDGSNNKWSNLRPSDRTTNNYNKRMSSLNTSGVKGVDWCKRSQLWRARVVNNKKEIHLGLFSTIEEAAKARQLYCEQTRGEFVREGKDAEWISE